MARSPAYTARDGMVVGCTWNTSGEALTLSEAADKAQGFVRAAAETFSPGLAATAMLLAGDLINAIHGAKSVAFSREGAAA